MDDDTQGPVGRSRVGDALDLLQSVFDPKRDAKTVVPPPSLQSVPAQCQNVSIECSFVVTDDAALNKPFVKSSTGLLLQQAWNGANAIFPMGFVKRGQTVLNPNQGPGPNVGDWDSNTDPMISTPHNVTPTQFDNWETFFGFSYQADTPLPFTDGVRGIQVAIGPTDTQTNYSDVRMFSSVISGINNTVPTGLADMNGAWAVASVADTRGVATVMGYDAFASTNLCQVAMKKGDGIRNIRGEQGVVSMLGADIQPRFEQFNRQTVDWVEGQSTTYTVGNGPVVVNLFTGVPSPVVAAAAWISPCYMLPLVPVNQFGNNLGASGFTPITPAQDPNLLIAETDSFDITFRYNIGVPGPLTQAVKIASCATHVFQNCNLDGSVNTYFVSETQQTLDELYQGSHLSSNLGVWHTSRFIARSFVQNFQHQGKYVGTYCQIRIWPTISTGQPGTAIGLININSVYADVKPHLSSQIGIRGPVRVMRWDNMGSGSNIRFEGAALIQGIPTPAAMPIIKSQMMFEGKYSTDASSLLLLTYLFNEVPMFNRVMTLKDFEKIQQWVKNATPNDIIKAIGKTPQALEALEAAGFFDTIASGLEHGLGAIGHVAQAALPVVGAGLALGRLLGAGGFDARRPRDGQCQ